MLKAIVRNLNVLTLFVVAFSPLVGAAPEGDHARIQSDLIAPWIVEVQGEVRTRTLLIRGAEPREDGKWVLDALYGWTDTRQSAVNALLDVKPEGYKLTLTTQANSIIVAESVGSGIMNGMFAPKSGNPKTIKLTRVTQDELAQASKNTLAAAQRAIIKPGPEVPAECASLVGGWKGQWGNGYGEEWLWVVQVDANCNAKYRFKPDGFRGPFFTAEIRNGVFSTPCANGGTCSFQHRGGQLWGNWYGPSGSNTIVLESVLNEPK